MKRGVIVLAAGVLLALCAAPAHASCAPSVRLHGTAYFPISTDVVTGEALRGGVIPGCNDTVITGPNGEDRSPREPDRPVVLRRIPGVPAAVAVAYNGTAHLAEGYVPWDAVPARPRATCGRPWQLRGIVTSPPAAARVTVVRTAPGRQRLLEVNGATVATGLARRGYGYIGRGQRVRATVRTCQGRLVALAIRRS